MAIFLDSSTLKDIEAFHRMGIIRGVTTNPSIMLRDGVEGFEGIVRRAKEIAALVRPLPVSVEVVTNDRAGMLDQARRFADLADNINVKITIHGPNGELDNLEVIHELETKHDVRINVTAMLSAQQCLMAAMAGASYVSLFAGRMNNMGYNANDELRRLRALLDRMNLPSRIIAGSTREVLNIVEWLEAGAHIVTALPDLVRGMLVHPYSKETVQMFLRDGEKLTALLAAKPARV